MAERTPPLRTLVCEPVIPVLFLKSFSTHGYNTFFENKLRKKRTARFANLLRKSAISSIKSTSFIHAIYTI